jgi:membrane-bound ClpP family serine protease
MFKERLIYTLQIALGSILGFLIVIAFMIALILGLLYLTDNPTSIAYLVLRVIVYAITVVILGALVMKYLHWQFIEPYRHYKKKEGNRK